MSISLIALIAVVLLIGWAISIHNKLVSMKINTETAWSDIDVYLKKRYDLLPNLVETVKGYALHEQETFEKVIAARSAYTNASTPDAKIAADTGFSGAMRQLFSLSEAYPDLKANTSFITLQSQLEEIEDHIAQSRRYYNAVTRDFNTAVNIFPNNIIARFMSFEQHAMYEANESEKAPVTVNFTSK